ncbi:RNA polymerase sigma factor, partial [Streptomyces griseoloalbus]
LAVWRGTARYRETAGDTVGADAAGWLWRIASRRLVDALRGAGARGRLRQTLARLRHRDEVSAEDRVLAGVEHGDLAGALVRLSPELRAVLQTTVRRLRGDPQGVHRPRRPAPRGTAGAGRGRPR